MKTHRYINLVKIASFLWIGLVLAILVGCGKNAEIHVHTNTYVPRKESTCQMEGNSEYWYCPSCEMKFSNAEMTEEIQQEELILSKKEHQIVLDNPVSPTCANPGLTEGSHCSVCKTVIVAQNEIKALDHSYDYKDITWAWDTFEKANLIIHCESDNSHIMQINATIESTKTEPTCTQAGLILYTASVKIGEETFQDTKEEILDATGHDFDLKNAKWIWTGTTAKVQLACKKDCEDIEEIDAQVKTTIIDPSCLIEGKRTSIATVEVKGELLTNQKEEIIPAQGHQFDYGTPLWSWRGTEEAFITLICSADSTHQEKHIAQLQSSSIPATCTETGKMTVTAEVLIDEYEYFDKREVVLPILEHRYDFEKVEFEWNKGNAIAKVYCENTFGKYHLYAASLTSVRNEPTCLEDGFVSYTASIVINRKKYTDTKIEILPALGHSFKADEVQWIWLEDGVYGKVICTEDNVEELLTASVTQKTIPATCVSTGSLMRIASIFINGEEYFDTLEEIIPFDTEAHTLDLSTIEWNWVKNFDSYEVKANITCGCGSMKQEFTDI